MNYNKLQVWEEVYIHGVISAQEISYNTGIGLRSVRRWLDILIIEEKVIKCWRLTNVKLTLYKVKT